jgi:NAD(P)-dependent dehydrogenase (short-subunit alcohol dehydrogenase family)
VTGTDAESARAQAAAAAATRRFTRPDEVAALAVVLASGRVGNMTGANVVIDGGLVKTS